jgi:hypothetical protein
LVFPCGYRTLQQQVRELQRLLGARRRWQENGILREAPNLTRPKAVFRQTEYIG